MPGGGGFRRCNGRGRPLQRYLNFHGRDALIDLVVNNSKAYKTTPCVAVFGRQPRLLGFFADLEVLFADTSGSDSVDGLFFGGRFIHGWHGFRQHHESAA